MGVGYVEYGEYPQTIVDKIDENNICQKAHQRTSRSEKYQSNNT